MRLHSALAGGLVTLSALFLAGCGDDDGVVGTEFDFEIPELKPPVEKSTPPALLAARRLAADFMPIARSLMICPEGCTGGGVQGQTAANGDDCPPDCQTLPAVIKSRLFSEGPTNFLYRLEKVDERAQQTVMRVQGNAEPPACLSADLQDWTASLPAGAGAFTARVQCEEEMNDSQGNPSGLKVYFGTETTSSGNNTYILEIQDPVDGMGMRGAVLASIDTMERVHVWQISAKDNTDSTWFEIKADPNVELLQIAFASSEQGNSGFGCGIKMHSSSGKMLMTGRFFDMNCDQEPEQEACIDAESLTILNITECATMRGAIDEDNISTLTTELAKAHVGDAETLVTTYGGITGLGSFAPTR